MNPLTHPWLVTSGNQVIVNLPPETITTRSLTPNVEDKTAKKPRPIVFFYSERAVADHIVALHNASLAAQPN